MNGGKRESNGVSLVGQKSTERRFLTIRRAVPVVIGLMLMVAGAVRLPRLLAGTSGDRDDNGVIVLPVETFTAKQSDSFELVRRYTGQVVARRSSDLGFELGGRLVSISVDEGDRVKAKQPLAKLDTHRLEAQRWELEAQKDNASALLDEMIAGPRTQTIDAARARVKELESRLKLFKDKRIRREKMYSEGAAPTEELSDAEREEEMAAAQLEVATDQLNELLAGTRKEKIRAQRAVVTQLDARLEQVDVALGGSVIKAPYAGMISKRVVDEGAVVDTGQTVLRVVEDGVLEARVGVPVSVAPLLEKASQQTVLIEGDEFEVIVSALLPELDGPTRTVTVVLSLTDAALGKVRPGQVVRLGVLERVEKAGVWLPMSALVKSVRGLWACYVLGKPTSDGSKTFPIEPRNVEVLHTEGDRVFVRGMLEDGDQIVKSGTHRIVTGQIVRVISNEAGQ